ncbi:MAG: Gfo/Idh/MocA family oxidoreductase [Bacteroidetes bacterium]|nr:Gfo/Idh/MocA family oxidoreductase [Bacteroidota bacterium]
MKMGGSVKMAKRILVCGAGSIGKRHIANLIQLGAEVTVWRSQVHLLKAIHDEFNVEVNENLDDAIEKADAVVIATATDNHIPIAITALQAGKALFIEKPLSHNWIGIEDLHQLSFGKIVEVGCQLRTHQNLIAFAKLLQQIGSKNILTYRFAMGYRLDAWRKGKDYRESYSVDEMRGGGALFDLIHQIDLAIWFFGPIAEVNAILSKRSELDISGDDVTNLLLTHSSGLTGHIQLDMASPVYRCEAEVMTTNSIFNWSYSQGILYNHTNKETLIVDQVPKEFVRNDLFIKHMAHFLERLIDNSVPPLCSLQDGISALMVAICAREANLSGKKIII